MSGHRQDKVTIAEVAKLAGVSTATAGRVLGDYGYSRQEIKDRVRKAAEDLGYSHMNLISGAGHDACWAAKVAPATMVMCPCVGGLSHNEAEDISREWAAAGADVLFHAVVETAEIVE